MSSQGDGSNKSVPVSKAAVEVSVGPNDKRSMDRIKADLSVIGLTANANLVGAYNAPAMGGDYSLTDLCHALSRMVKDAKSSDGRVARDLLVPQASVLNAIANNCFARALANMGEYPEAMERYMRLGLKAQSQCRTTLESLSKIMNPPNVAFVKQANFANGPQQVNNGMPEAPTQPPIRAENLESSPIELLETDNGKWLDPSEASAAINRHKEVAAVGEIHRTTDKPRKSRVQP